MSESEVRRAFADQAEICAKLGSQFTGRLCAVLGRVLDKTTQLGRRALDWSGQPDIWHDNVPLRITGGLHALVRSGQGGALARLYPPAPLPEEQILADAVANGLAEKDATLVPWLDRPPQTNEVGRSAVLMSGLLEIAARFPFPLHLYELGASAGLNLLLDQYGYDLGGLRCGQTDSPVQLRPQWRGGPPPDAKVRVIARRGVDRDPLDAVRDADALLAYVWPDQPERLARLEAALDIARKNPPEVDRADAADWIERRLAVEPQPGVTRVVLHSIAFQYFPPQTQAQVRSHIEKAGERANETAPLAWLRFEMLGDDREPSVRLRTWPGEERLLAWTHPHGSSVEWLEG